VDRRNKLEHLSWKAFPAKWNVTVKLIGPFHKLRRKWKWKVVNMTHVSCNRIIVRRMKDYHKMIVRLS
jgi:hypothetical protein